MSTVSYQKHNFFRNALYYAMFLLCLWVCYLALISAVSSFHFMLDHRLSVIEEWLFVYSWELTLIAKLFAAFIGLKFVLVKSDARLFRSEFKGISFINEQKSHFVVAFLFLFLSLIVVGNPKLAFSDKVTFLGTFTSYIGIIIFYGSDFIFLYSMKKVFPNYGFYRIVKLVLFPAIFYVTNRWIFVYSENISYLSVFTMYILTLLSEFERDYSFLPLFFLAFAIAPIATFFGLDPMFGAENSLFIMTKTYSISSLTIIALVFTGYLVLKKFGIKVISRYLKICINHYFVKIILRK